MSLVKEFKDFALKGNVVDLAVGVVIGGAFGKLVEAVVKGIIEPIVLLSKGEAEGAKVVFDGVWNFGSGLLNFLMLAAIVFFVFVKPMNKLRALTEKKIDNNQTPPPVPDDVRLLIEIRDLLKQGKDPSPPTV